MVGAVRLELMTSCMSSMRSNQLSYVPRTVIDNQVADLKPYKAYIYYHNFSHFTSEYQKLLQNIA